MAAAARGVKATRTSPAFATSGTPKVELTFTVSTPAPCTPTRCRSRPWRRSSPYKDFTGSAPTTAQNNQWVPAIGNCSTTADALIVSLIPTNQTTLDDARLVRLYLAYFNRPPDPSGFAYWQRQLDAGKGLINAAKKFAESSEFKTKYGTLSNSDFVELVYQNVLGRASEPAGKTFWVTRLDNKTKNRGDVMIIPASENVTKKVNHVQIFRMYRSMMAVPVPHGLLRPPQPILNNAKTSGRRQDHPPRPATRV